MPKTQGIAFTFLRIHNCQALPSAIAETSLIHANNYIQRALAAPLKPHKEACAFLCGSAGVYAVAAVVAHQQKDNDGLQAALSRFADGFEGCAACKWDEILVGRAGFLSGVHWLNSKILMKDATLFKTTQWFPICTEMADRGRLYAKSVKSSVPMMYQYHGTEYLGAAHGLSGILQVMLMHPEWLTADANQVLARDVWRSVDALVEMLDANGDFPTATDSTARNDRKLTHWCHGAGGFVYLMLQAHQRRPQNDEYIKAAHRAADACWQRGLLKKGPGICHGIAGNGYVSLIMYRHTQEMRYLLRAVRFAEFLTDERFRSGARQPDRPYSMYEGIAGTICFLCDLLEPEKATFPFMEIIGDE